MLCKVARRRISSPTCTFGDIKSWNCNIKCGVQIGSLRNDKRDLRNSSRQASRCERLCARQGHGTFSNTKLKRNVIEFETSRHTHYITYIVITTDIPCSPLFLLHSHFVGAPKITFASCLDRLYAYSETCRTCSSSTNFESSAARFISSGVSEPPGAVKRYTR
jgi:hypothetical protein